MNWSTYTNMADFWVRSKTYFFENESRYVKILSYFLEKESDDLEDHYAWLLESDNEIKAFAMLFPNGSLHCGELLEHELHLDDLLQSIQTSNVQIKVVVAPTSIVQRLLDALTGDFELEMNQKYPLIPYCITNNEFPFRFISTCLKSSPHHWSYSA